MFLLFRDEKNRHGTFVNFHIKKLKNSVNEVLWQGLMLIQFK